LSDREKLKVEPVPKIRVHDSPKLRDDLMKSRPSAKLRASRLRGVVHRLMADAADVAAEVIEDIAARDRYSATHSCGRI
jgi:hypothetical protein